MSPYIIESIGVNQARKYFTTGEVIGAEKALEIGLIHDIVSKNELESSNNLICNTLSNYNTKSLRLLKKLFGEYMKSDDQKLASKTIELLYEAASFKETREKISALASKTDN